MSELKIACPKCGGHLAFPAEMARQKVPCPHCQEAIILGARPRALLWSIVAVGLGCAIAGSAFLFWHLAKARTNPALRPGTHVTTVFAQNETASLTRVTTSEDARAIEALCRAMYDRCNARDFASMHHLLTAPCRAALTAAELGDAFGSGVSSFRFVALESITYPDGPSGKLAKARFRRVACYPDGENEETREFKCVREQEGWKLFRDTQWAEKIFADFVRSGFSEEVCSNVQQFCASNPFEKWPMNKTNAFEKMYELVHPGVKAVYPWNLSFSVTTNYLDGYRLMVGFSVRNEAAYPWDNPGLRLELRQNNTVLLEGFPMLSKVRPGTEVHLEEAFFLRQPLLETTRYGLDAHYTLSGGEECFLTANLPVEVKVRKLTEVVKCDVVRSSFERGISLSGDEILTARLDYRVRNVGPEPLKRLQLRFVWFMASGEVWDQTTEYVVGYGDLPLAPQQTKAGFAHCGKGFSHRRVPVNVDVYLADGERSWPLYKGLRVD